MSGLEEAREQVLAIAEGGVKRLLSGCPVPICRSLVDSAKVLHGRCWARTNDLRLVETDTRPAMTGHDKSFPCSAVIPLTTPGTMLRHAWVGRLPCRCPQSCRRCNG